LLAKDDFDQLLLRAVDEALASLGDSSRQAIYFHLERSFGIVKQEIPCKIRDFVEAIHTIFGLGANFLEILIMERLHEKVGGVFGWNESTSFTLIEYVTVVKRAFQERNGSGTLEAVVELEEEGIKLE